MKAFNHRIIVFLLLLLSGGGTPLAYAQGDIPVGAINGIFSVSACQQVQFSQGNLQYIGSADTPYWQFAEHQWDYLGDNTGQDSDDPTVDRDLFGWGTSGYHDPDDPYNVNYEPWSVYQEEVNTLYNGFGYGPSTNLKPIGFMGTPYDWGINNVIANGGEQPSLWRTLTHEEWNYLLQIRNTATGIRFAKAQVNEVNGVILLPDDWSESYYILNDTNAQDAAFESNVIADSLWVALEEHGAVFLPVGGFRNETSIYYAGEYGFYWSSSSFDASQAWMVRFDDVIVNANILDYRYGGVSVRLVRSVQQCSYNIDASPYPVEGGTILGAGLYEHAATVTLTASANGNYRFMNWTENGIVVSTDTTYSFSAMSDRSLVAHFDRPHTVTFDPGSGSCVFSSLTESAWHGGVVLPAAIPTPACVCNGYTFQGWTTSPVEATLVQPDLYMAGEVFYPASDLTLFAVYAVESTDGWRDITDVADFVEGNYVIATKDVRYTYYLPVIGSMINPMILRMSVNAQGEPVSSQGSQPLAPNNLWTISKINATQYSISHQTDSVTYYLKAFDDTNYGIQITTYEPSTGWEISQDATYGLLLRFPAPEPDPSKAVRYLSKTNESWASLTLYTYKGTIHLYLCPSPTYSTYPDCHCEFFTQATSLVPGWNWWAPTVECTLAELETALGTNALTIKSKDATATYSDGQWSGTLSGLTLGQMYRIETSNACEFTLNGTRPASVPFTFSPGQNWFGCTGTEPLSIADFFGNITPTIGDKVISQDAGFAIFNGSEWEGTLDTLQPGHGYVYVSQGTTTQTRAFGSLNK